MMDKDTLLKTTYYEQPYQKEKDYLQELFLSAIYERSAGLVFKGGTAMSKFYGLPRFSDDLDFSVSESLAGSLASELDTATKDVSMLYSTRVQRKIEKPGILTHEFSIRGPLFEMSGKHQHLKIEIGRDKVFEAPEVLRRNPRYADIRPYVAVVMKAEEILAEKADALMFRHNAKARDLFDLYFLIKRGTGITLSLIDKKMREHGHAFTDEKLAKRMDVINGIWEKELRRLLPKNEFVGYAEAKECVLDAFKESGLL